MQGSIREARRRLSNLIEAVENGSSTPTILQALKQREDEIEKLEADPGTLNNPIEQKLAVVPCCTRP